MIYHGNDHSSAAMMVHDQPLAEKCKSSWLIMGPGDRSAGGDDQTVVGSSNDQMKAALGTL